jgi:5-methylcytosine-specific restriction protein A
LLQRAGNFYVNHLKSAMNIVTFHEEIAANVIVFDSYRTSKNALYRSFFRERLRLGKIFVYGIVGVQHVFAPSRFAGYSQCTLEKHAAFPNKDGKVTTPQITRLLGKPQPNPTAEAAYIALCKLEGVEPSGKERTYWHLDLPKNLFSKIVAGGAAGFPNEVGSYVEGATERVVVNAYERNEKARSACLSHYGFSCSVCTFNFESEFGAEIGGGFMQVHHLKPISVQGGTYMVDPIEDLRPVCPNCHAMLHKSDPPFTIEELQEIRVAAKDA